MLTRNIVSLIDQTRNELRFIQSVANSPVLQTRKCREHEIQGAQRYCFVTYFTFGEIRHRSFLCRYIFFRPITK